MIFMARFREKESRYQAFGWNRGSASDVTGASVLFEALDFCKADDSYVSKLWSGLLEGPVTRTLRRVGIRPPVTPAISCSFSGRAPVRPNTRLSLLFDIRFLLSSV